jgi:hypothetical protein
MVLNMTWRLFRRDDAEGYFQRPVDPRAYPEYYALVPEPMDLSTVEARVRHGNFYATFRDFCSDVELIGLNCMHFNAEGSSIWRSAFNFSVRARAQLAEADRLLRQRVAGLPPAERARLQTQCAPAVPRYRSQGSSPAGTAVTAGTSAALAAYAAAAADLWRKPAKPAKPRAPRVPKDAREVKEMKEMKDVKGRREVRAGHADLKGKDGKEECAGPGEVGSEEEAAMRGAQSAEQGKERDDWDHIQINAYQEIDDYQPVIDAYVHASDGVYFPISTAICMSAD